MNLYTQAYFKRKYIIGYIGKCLCFVKNEANLNSSQQTIIDKPSRYIVKAKNNEIMLDFSLINKTSSFSKKLKNKLNKSVNDKIYLSLEEQLFTLLKSFNQFNFNDDKIKLSIFKEMLECKRLLLKCSLNLNKNTENKPISMDTLYNEWKILAIVTDRIFFILYLLAHVFFLILFTIFILL